MRMIGIRRAWATPALLTVAWMTTAGAPAPSPAQPGPPLNLRCEYRENPLGLDITAPRLSWQVNDARRGAVQSAYQIVVSTDPAMGDPARVVWDTGKVASDQSVQVPYAGPPLASRTRYFWQVRTWEGAGRPGPYAQPAWFETALLEPGDWRATWISADRPPESRETLTWGSWIWDDRARGDNRTAFLRRTFTLDKSERVAEAKLKIAVDDKHTLFLNGTKLGDHTGWNVAVAHTVTDIVKPGLNVLAVRGVNATGPCGMNLTMRVKFISGKTVEIRSDGQWRSSDQAEPGWTSPDFDDTGWRSATVVAQFGDEPWVNVNEPKPPRRAMCLRKPFEVRPGVARARVYVTGLGIYELRLNGAKVGKDLFTPGWTHYYKRLQYQTYDVTQMLRDGANAIAATLGNGWWSGGLGWKSADSYSDSDLCLLAQLEIEYTDGSRDVLVTDNTWKAHPSPILRNTYYHGETYDARAAMPGWDTAGFDDGGWWRTKVVDAPEARLVAQRCATIQVTQELTAQVSEPDPGVFIFDFGQNAAGRPRLKVKGAEPGTRIRLRFGEELDPNGRLYRDNYRSAQATDEYICAGGPEEVWTPIFTYRGFRYCEVTGYPARPDDDAVVHQVLHTACPMAGTFACADWLINHIYRNILWGQRSNLHSVPTDCPQRDERLGWMGDAQAFGHTSCFNMDMAGFYTKWMFDVTDSQSPEGAVTDVSPAKVVTGAAKPGWGDAVVVIPWTVYRFYGDTRIIEQNYDAMVGWVEYMRRQSKDDLYETPGYGDWVPVVNSPSEWIGSAYYYYSTKLLSKMAAAIGRDDDADKYRELAGRIARAFNAKHLNKATNNYVTGTQTCNILPTYFGITPADRVDAVMANIAADIEVRGDHLSTGFLGTTYLMPLLAQQGYQELAYRLATQDTYPSWGYMIRHGATTIWERWDTDKHGPAMNSRNHFAYGAVARWFYEDLAGINLDPDVPGFKRIVIRPRPADDLAWARAEYPCMYGTIRSAWRRTDEGIALDVTIPANASARVFVPTLGRSDATVSEGGTIIVRDGHAVAHTDGVKFVRSADAYVLFEVGAGTYAFATNGG